MKYYFNLSLLILILLVPFVPYLGTIDKIASQWLYLSLINTFLIILNIKEYNYFFYLKEFIKIPHFTSYILFVILAVFSLTYSNNISLSLVEISRIITVLLLVFNASIFFLKYKFNLHYLSICISIVLFLELIISLYPLFNFLIFSDLQLLDFGKLQPTLLGVSGNRNVLAFDIVFKFPFLLLLLLNDKKYFKFISLFLIFLASFLLILLSSRAALITFFFICLFFSFHIIYSTKSVRSFVFLLPIIISILFSNYLNKNKYNVVDKIASIGFSDESTNHRIFLYENAFDYIFSHPFYGCGIGNWKVESLPYWKDRLSGYTIPYHAHNDFLEISTEIGVFGGIFYLFFFILIFVLFFFRYLKKNNTHYLLILLMCSIYFFDANINFPMERALSQVNLIILMSTSIIFYFKDSNEKVI